MTTGDTAVVTKGQRYGQTATVEGITVFTVEGPILSLRFEDGTLAPYGRDELAYACLEG
jgi:hypothetical protein